jgi:dTDP-4-dehydrorhamnose reductase
LILVTGGRGEFAQHIKRISRGGVLTPSSGELDIREYYAIRQYLLDNEVDYIVHAGALTRPMVIHERDPALSIETNIIGTGNVARLCYEFDIKMIYISTDYVYAGDTGDYKETDPVKPFNNYGRSKLGGECATAMCPHSLILRMGMTSDVFPHEYAFTDVYKSSIYSKDAARITLMLLDEQGIINVGGPKTDIYSFVSPNNPHVQPTTLGKTNVRVGKDSSMDVTKMRKLLHVTDV